MKKSISREALHRYIYVYALALLVCCLPLSRYFLSISQFILALNWIAEGEFRKKLVILRGKPGVYLFISIVLVYGAGLILTENMNGGTGKVINVLPMLALPVIMSTSKPLNAKITSGLLILFTWAVTAAAIICLIMVNRNPMVTSHDFRKISYFMPHIRFALLIVMSIFILLYEVFYKPAEISHPLLKYILPAVFLFAFLFVLRSFAGVIIFLICASIFVISYSRRITVKLIRHLIVWGIFVLYLLVILTVASVYLRNFHAPPVDLDHLDKYTANGNPYDHDISLKTLENGNYVNLYVCEPELQKEWNARSRIRYDSIDFKGQPVQVTLKRYLSSKGLRKDSAGLSKLSAADIQAIEKGRANYHFKPKPGFYQRLYETLWEIHIWRTTGFVRYHSFGQRIVFLQTAAGVIRNHPLTGVGTGDVYATMMTTIRNRHIEIERRWKGEPHNQFAFFLMAFGFLGFIWIMISWIYPALRNKSYNMLLFNLFSVIVFISMLVLDTIESYDSIVFFSFFYTLFVFCYPMATKNLTAGSDNQV